MFVLHDGSLCPPKIPEPDWNRSVENRIWIPDAVDRIIRELKAEGLRFVTPPGPGAPEKKTNPKLAA